MDDFKAQEPKNNEFEKSPRPLKRKGILEKLREQPEYVRRLILWLAVIIVGFFLFFLWLKYTGQRLKSLPRGELKEKFQIPSFEEQWRDLSELEAPEISEEELKKIEEELQNLEKEENSTGVE